MHCAEPAQSLTIAPFRGELFDEIVRAKDPAWLVHGLIPARSLTMVFGDSAAGKTHIVTHVGINVAAGLALFGNPSIQQATAYVAGEGANGMRARIDAVKRHRPELDGKALPFLLIADEIRLLDPVDIHRLYATLDDYVCLLAKREMTLGIVVLDTLAHLFSGADENSSIDAATIVRVCASIRDRYGCAVLVVHHSGKNPGLGPRGHSSIRAAFDAVLEVKRVGRNRSSLTIEKMRDGEADRSFDFGLKQIELGQGPEGEPVTSCVVEELGPARREAAQRTSAENVLLEALVQTIQRRGEPSRGRFGLPDDASVACRADVLAHFLGTPFARSRSDAAARQAFARAVRRLADDGALGSASENSRIGWLWLLQPRPPPNQDTATVPLGIVAVS